MTFLWPWAWLGLLALPAAAAIYWLRRRARRRPVSSLLLWREAPQSRASGRRVEHFEASRLLPLELLILALLVGAAAGPRLPARDSRRPLVVVLDDSFSMLAGGEASPCAAAGAALLRELESDRHGAVTLVAAGERPRVLGEGTSAAAGDVAGRLELWRATSPSANLEAAIGLATDVAGGRARLLVLSDHPPPEEPAAGRLAWWAFGRALPNLALVGAVRGPDGRGETSDGLLVEVANYSPNAALARLAAAEGDGQAVEVARLRLAPGEVGRARFAVPRGEDARLRLAGDGNAGGALEIDDRAILLPERSRGVRVALEIADPGLREQIRRALAASERAIFSPDGAELVITDAAGADPEGAWSLRLVTGGEAVPYLGPFVLDRGHPLTAGLGLDGVIWAAGGGFTDGAPVVAAGEVTLLADRETAGSHRLTLFWRPELSTLQRTPNWPILWWNLLEWRARSVPGVRAANLRLGGEATVGLVAGHTSRRRRASDNWAELELPDGSRRRLATRGGSLKIAAEQAGIHRLSHGGRSDRWAVNALAAEESDLRRAASGRWGGWQDDAVAGGWQRRGIGWALLLLAAAGMVLHLVWSRKG